MPGWRGPDKAIERAFAQATRGNVDDALAGLREAAGRSDPTGERAEAIGTICYQGSRWQEAAQAFAQAWNVQHDNMMRLYFLASALSRAGEWDGALALLDKLAAERPADVAPLSARCLILADKPDFDQARKAYELARRVFNDNPAQEHLSMGLLQQCADTLMAIPNPPGK